MAQKYKRYEVLAQLGCCICGQPAQIHHLIGVKYRGLGQKANDDQTIPLCMHHHTGGQGIHTLGKRAWELKYGDQAELLKETDEQLQKYVEMWHMV